jgi:hypothetical protein
MARYVSDKDELKKVYEAFYQPNPPVIGGFDGDRETKYMGYRVLVLGDQLYACVTDQDGSFSCAEAIYAEELGPYVDDEDAALEKLNALVQD